MHPRALPRSLVLARRMAFGVPLVLLGGALVGQYAFGLIPCALCVDQRWPHLAALLLAGAAFAVRDRAAVRWLIVIAAGGLATTAAIGGYHLGVEQGWWLGPNCATALGTGDPLADILARPVVACDRVQWSLFGLSLAAMNLILSGLAAIAVVWLALSRTGRSPDRAVAA